MSPKVIARDAACPGGTCPTTYEHPDPAMAYVQGYLVTDPNARAEFNLPEGEGLLAVPNTLLADHVRAMQA